MLDQFLLGIRHVFVTFLVHFIINISSIEIIFDLANKTFSVLFNILAVSLESKMEKRNSQCEHGQSMVLT